MNLQGAVKLPENTWRQVRKLKLPRLLFAVSSNRATVEAAIVYVLSFSLYIFTGESQSYVSAATIYGLMISITWGTVRLQLMLGQRRIRLPEGFVLLKFTVALYICWLLMVIIVQAVQPNFQQESRLSFWQYAGQNLIAFLVLVALFFSYFRSLAYIWHWLNGQQRRHLRWALTYAHFKLAVFVISAATLYVAYFWVSMVYAASSNLNQIVYFVISAILFVSLISVIVLFVMSPLALIFSYLTMRPIVRRLESLVKATHALRSGNYAARVEIKGEDEVGQLQTDFNAMAEKLESAVQTIEAERDRVNGLLQSNRELVASVSHELRTPVAAIRGYLEPLIEAGDAPPPNYKQDLAIVNREVLRLQTIIEDLFALSRAEVGKLTLKCEAGEIAPHIRRVVETAAPLGWQNRKVQVLAETPSNLPLAHFDGGRLEQILSNLVQNAIRHTPPGGLVVVSATVEPEYLRLEVRDTGEGIAPEDLPHIWQRFYRAENATTGGAGLGLALVKELTCAMGGNVEVSSTPGKGSTFTIRLKTVEQDLKLLHHLI
jgi:signal transduction histidine kinase